MKKHQTDSKSWCGLFTGLLLSLCSCSGNLRPSLSPIPTITMLGETPTLTATKIFTPAILTSTITKNPLPSMTPLPTLADYKVQEYLTNLIQNPQDCKLPCWWGITPGASSWQVVEDFMFHLGIENIEPTYSYDFSEDFVFDKGLIYHYMMMKKKADKVSQIWFSAQTDYEPAKFGSIWNLYSPKKILAAYGKPSRVFLYISTVNADNPASHKIGEGYRMWFFYDPQGFLISYVGFGKLQNQNIHICPTLGQEDIESINFYLQDPTSLSPLEYNIAFQEQELQPLPLDNATGLTIDQFMGLATGKISCFDTPYAIWP